MEIHAKNRDISLYVDVRAGDYWVQNRNGDSRCCSLEAEMLALNMQCFLRAH